MECVCIIRCRFLVRAKRAKSSKASEASHLYLYNNLVNKNHKLSEIAQKMIGNGAEIRKIVIKSIE